MTNGAKKESAMIKDVAKVLRVLERKHEKELMDAGVTESQYKAAAARYETAGISFGRVPRRGWRIFKVGTGKGPTYVTLWASLNDLVLNCDSLVTSCLRKAAGED
jgi:hypothetical protein